MSAGEALQTARGRLAPVSQMPRRDAERLLARVLGWDQTALWTHPERLLSPAEAAQFENYLTRRVASEPMQYILGEQEFFGLSFVVTQDVLIPRPETEHLVEAVLAHVPRQTGVRILDVGTGSGAIAVALAHALPHAHVTAVDLSRAALEVAQSNAERHHVEQRITFRQSDLLAAVGEVGFDVVVSNPPYIADGDVLENQVSQWEPHSALYAGPTGLEIYERLIPQACEVLDPNGWLMLEIGFGQQPAVQALLSGWRAVSFVNDLQKIPRVVIAQATHSVSLPRVL